MKINTMTLSLLVVSAIFIVVSNTSQYASAPTLLTNDTPVTGGPPVPEDYQFEVLSEDHAVIGVRSLTGDDFDIEVYEDTTFTTMIESSTSVGDAVDFVVLDKTTWASPPNRAARVTSGSTSYIIEMENDVDDYTIMDSWSGSMDASPDNPVLDLGPPGSWDDVHVYGATALFDGKTYHMWYHGFDGLNPRIGYATSPDGITWTKYAGNPVLDIGPPGSWDDNSVSHPTVLYDGATYHLWYSAADGSKIRIGYANSSDGLTWTKYAGNPVLDVGPPGSWEDNILHCPMVLYDGATYHMWYQGHDDSNYRIGYATSPDGITWTKYAGNPVLDLGPPGSWDDTHVVEPMVLYDGTTYYMWYGGGDGLNARIGYATSPDGIAWTKNPTNPVLDLGPPSSWDDFFVSGPTVLYDGATYHMWYAGHDGANYRIGYANSKDKDNWMKGVANPVLDLGPPGSWDDEYVAHPTVLYDGTKYHMWYTGLGGSNYRIGYANSYDGITWTKHPSNPVVDTGPSGTWDDHHTYSPIVLYDGTTYHMWYSGYDGAIWKIGYATSSDGMVWTKSGANPVLDLGAPGAWDDSRVYAPTVLYDGTTYHMWYSGYDGSYYRIGYATSPNGIAWTKSGANPVLDVGAGGTWDDNRIFAPSVLYKGKTYHMWYTGYDGFTYRIGYATSPDEIAWVKSVANPVLDLGPPGSWEDIHVHSPTVLYDGETYHMWYSGEDGLNTRIGYATYSIKWAKLTSSTEVLDAYEIIGINAGSTCTITLDVPQTADLDLFIYDTTGGRDDALASSTNIGAGINESISFIAPTTGDYLLVITNEDGGTGTYTVTQNNPPVADAGDDQVTNEGDVVQLNGSASYDPDGTIETYKWDFESDGIYDYVETINSSLDGAFDGKTSHIYGDNGIYIVTLRVTDDTGFNDTDSCNVSVNNVAPIVDALPEVTINELESVTLIGHATDPGSDDLTFTWFWEYAPWGDKTTIYYNDGTGPDPYPSPTINPRNITEDATCQYGDDGVFTVILTVSDDDDGSTTITANITVKNIAPLVTIESATMDVEISLRVAGSKWSNVGLTLYENGTQIGYLETERWPGNPNDNPTYENPALPTIFDMTKSYSAIVTYDPYPDKGDEIKGDQPNNGKDKKDNAGNPIWIVLRFDDGSEERIHHTFNTQQSKKRDSDHWNHIEPWDVDLMSCLIGHPFEMTAHITDPGSDDETLACVYGSQSVTVTYLNSPPNPDPYPSPEVNPRDVTGSITLIYEGSGTIILTVEDDDSGTTSASFDLA